MAGVFDAVATRSDEMVVILLTEIHEHERYSA